MSAGRRRREDEPGRGGQSSRAATRAAAAASVAHERPRLVGITPNQPRSDALSALAFDGPQGAPRRSTLGPLSGLRGCSARGCRSRRRPRGEAEPPTQLASPALPTLTA